MLRCRFCLAFEMSSDILVSNNSENSFEDALKKKLAQREAFDRRAFGVALAATLGAADPPAWEFPSLAPLPSDR